MLKNLREAIERFLSHTPLEDESGGETSLPFSPRQKRTSGERVRSQETRQRRLALYRASSITFITREELFWELPDNSIWVIGGYATLFDLPTSPNGANQQRPKVLLIPIGPIYKNDGNKDAAKMVLYGKNSKHVVSRAAG